MVKLSCEDQREAAFYSSLVALLASFCHLSLKQTLLKFSKADQLWWC